MKILYLLTQDLESPSGLGRYAPMARELARRGHQVSVAALHSNYAALAEKRSIWHGVDVHYVAPMHVRKQGSIKSYYSPAALLAITARATLALTMAALQSSADIIHIGKPHPMNTLAGMLARPFKHGKLLLDLDDYEAGVGHFRGRWQKSGVTFFENRAPFWVDHITTNTHFTCQRLIGTGVPAGKISYISNGVDRERFAAPSPQALQALREQLNLENHQVIAFIGSLSRPGHPVDLLFEAFAIVHQAMPGAILLIVGGGDDYHRLEEQAAEMGLADCIRFTGRISPNQVSLYYHLADVSIDPVYEDGAARGRSPLKLFESWACGVPFISSDVGDRRYLLGDPSAGLLAYPGDPTHLARCILDVLSNQRLAGTLQDLGAQRVKAFYWHTLVKELEQVYLNQIEK